MNCIQKFEQIYLRTPDMHAFCPYRVCPIGAHSDHQLGRITGFAIDKGIHIAYKAKNNGVVELISLQFDKRAQWHVNSVFKERQYDWADYLRGATIALSKRFDLEIGIAGVIEGELPIGGLSSSAAVILCFLSALCHVNNLHLSEKEMVEIALEAENSYVGVACGKLDQSCEVYSKKDHLLYLDTKDDTYELIPTHPDMKPHKIMVFFSGLERNLAGYKFNMRVDECRAAAYALQAYSGYEYGKFEEAYLRNIPREIYDAYKNQLPETWKRRAEHWYTEYERVKKGAEAWRKGDIDEFGKLSFESGYSSIHNWETGSPELIKLYELMKQTEGIYGGRFSGAGFKGCCMALVDPAYTESVANIITKEYLKTFPHLEGKYSVHICESADGVKL